MKKQFITLFSIGLLFSCGSEKDVKTDSAPPAGMHLIDLSAYGKPFSIYVPDTNTAKPEISEQPSGALEVKVGNNFAISIYETAANLALKKEDIQADEVNRFKSFIVDQPEGMIWESGITQPEFHFLLNKQTGGSEYSFEDIRDPELKPFGKEAVERMFESSKKIIGNKNEKS
jgi:hypothetical protein